MVTKRQRGGSGARKYGRNEAGCKRYKTEQRREKNKLRKLRKIARKQLNNQQLFKRIKELENEVN